MFVAPPSHASPLGPPIAASRGPLAASASAQFGSSPSSQFNSPSASAQNTAPPSPAQAQFQSPLHVGGPLGRSTTMPGAGPLGNGSALPAQSGFDPLGQARPSFMSQSVRVTPQRPRLDAREAASKLANMF